jgi:hypothetical protein
VPAGGTFEVRLVCGSLRAETSVGRETDIILVRQDVRSDPASARLIADTTIDAVRIEDRYPRTGGMDPRHDCLPPEDARGNYWHSDVRLSTIVRVPANVRLVVHLVDGDIDVRAVIGPRDVFTNQGVIRGVAHLPSLAKPFRAERS